MAVFLMFVASLVLGVTISIHLAMNAQVGEVLGSPRTGNMLFWLIGAATGLLIWAVSADTGALAKVKSVSPPMWLAGAMGASLVLGIAFLMPRLGVVQTTVGLLVGQLIAGAVISHFGWLDSPVAPLNLTRSIGIGCAILGTVLVVR